MTQLTPIQLEDGTTIYLETQEDIQVVAREPLPPESGKEITRTAKGGKDAAPEPQIPSNFQAIETTIRAYTNSTLNAFRQVASANIDKVTLEFGIKVGGKAGIPYVTEGSAESHLKVTVECSFPTR